MKKSIIVLSACFSMLVAIPNGLCAASMTPTVNENVGMSYKDTIIYLNHHMRKNWNKRPTYFKDGMTYSAEVNQGVAIFKVRRYSTEDSHLHPFLVVKIFKEPDAQSRVAVWEGDYAYDSNKNLSKQIKSWLKKCKKGCSLSDQSS